MIENEVRDRERLTTGLAVHEATWEDDERLSDLYANSSERLGDWDVNVERFPNPYAQQRMQENAHVKMLVERGVALGVNAAAGRSSMVAGQQLSVSWMGAWRIRNGFRRLGFASLMMNAPGSSSGVFGMISYWYVRVENATANAWIVKAVGAISDAGETARAMEKLTATVHHLHLCATAKYDERVARFDPTMSSGASNSSRRPTKVSTSFVSTQMISWSSVSTISSGDRSLRSCPTSTGGTTCLYSKWMARSLPALDCGTADATCVTGGVIAKRGRSASSSRPT